MGKKIDRFALTLAAALALYLYFSRAFGHRALAAALSVLCCALGSRLLGGACSLLRRSPWARRRSVRRQAGGALMQLACLPREEALAAVEALLRRSYAGDYAVDLIQLPPSAEVDQARLFEAWRAHRGCERLALCASCPAGEACRPLAAELRAPRVALLDAPLLAQLYAEHPDALPAPCATSGARPRLRLRRAASRLLRRRYAPRCLILSLSMLLLYALGANLSYLIASLLLFVWALASVRAPARPARLFPIAERA